MTEKQAEAFKSINSVIESIEGNLKSIDESVKEIRALNEIKRILKTVTRTETLEDRIQRKLKEL
jgi:uncharacterized protein Yka (UPF0111/DUF47 family)